MRIIIETIPHDEQDYRTVGNWKFDKNDGTISVFVSETGHDDSDFLVGLHEMIEAYACRKYGITQNAVDEFDAKYELERKDGKHRSEEEPGDDYRAPYFEQHQFATSIENIVASFLRRRWASHGRLIDKVYESGD